MFKKIKIRRNKFDERQRETEPENGKSVSDSIETQTVECRDRRVERQIRWPEALFRRLATLPLSDSVPL